jgi:hypothetical protein
MLGNPTVRPTRPLFVLKQSRNRSMLVLIGAAQTMCLVRGKGIEDGVAQRTLANLGIYFAESGLVMSCKAMVAVCEVQILTIMKNCDWRQVASLT